MLSRLTKIFPFLSWITLLQDSKVIKKDVLAGMSVSFILIPQSMAYAQLAGLPVEVGLYTAFIPVIIAALFGSSPQMSTGPVTIVSLMTATALAPLAVQNPDGYILYASLLAFMTWCMYILIGNLHLWVIVDFLSHPVIVGFTNAAAVLTITSQLAKIFWVTSEKWSNYLMTLYSLGESILHSTHIPTLICGIWSIIFLIWIGKIAPKIPKVLFLLLFSITISYFLWYSNVFWGKIVGDIPANLPWITFDFLNISSLGLGIWDIIHLLVFSLIIWLVGFTESISVAKFVSYTTKQRLSPNKELIWQWLANVSSSLFGGYGVAGSFSKTAVNLKSWATTWLSGVVTGLMVWCTLMFLTPFIAYLPVATLAAIIMVAVTHMIRFSPLINAWSIEKHDAIIGYITFFTTLAFVPNIEIGIAIWVGLSLVLYIYRSMRPKVTELGLYKDGTYRDIDLFWLKSSPNIWVYRFDGNLYFANAGFFESQILNAVSEKEKMKYIILDFEWVNTIDSSAEDTLRNLTLSLDKHDIKVYITGIRTKVFEKLTRSKFVKDFWEKRIYTNIAEALEKIEKKNNKKINLTPLQAYKKDKKREPELEKKVIKKIEKLGD